MSKLLTEERLDQMTEGDCARCCVAVDGIRKLWKGNARLREALELLRSLYPNAEWLDDLDDDAQTGRRLCNGDRISIRKLRTIDATLVEKENDDVER